MVEAGKHFWKLSYPKHCSEQGQLQKVAQGFLQSTAPTLETSKLSWNTCSCSWLPHSKRCLLVFKLNFHYFSFCAIAPCPVTCHHWAESCSVFLISHNWVFVHVDNMWQMSLHLSRINNSRSLSLFSSVRALNHLWGTPSSSSASFFFWRSQNKMQHSRNSSLELLVAFCLMQPRVPLVFCPARAHCWSMVSLCCLCKAAFQQLDLSFCWCQGLFLHKHRTQLLPSLNYKRFF